MRLFGRTSVAGLAGEGCGVLVEYWLAGWLGRAWLGVRRGLRLQERDGELPSLCAAVGRGRVLHAGQLRSVQDFAVRMWWRFGFASCVLMVAIGLTAEEAAGGVAPRPVLDVVIGLIFVMAVASAQVVTILYRLIRTQLHLRKVDAEARFWPLPPGAPGMPRRFDFWVTAAIAVTVCAGLLNWGLHSPH